jgi:hypothetical protein
MKPQVGGKDRMENKETKEMDKQQERVVFWGGENEDKQELSMDWSHDGHFWIALSTDKVDEIVSLVRQLLSDKLGGDWSDRPSPHASGQYLEIKHHHHLFAMYSRKGLKERFAEVHPSDTGRTIFIRFWQGLHQEAKASLERHGFQYHSQIPDHLKIKMPHKPISPEKTAALEKFRTSQPLTVPEGKARLKRGGGGKLIGLVVVVLILATGFMLLRSQLFGKAEPLELGSFLAAKGYIASFETIDGKIVYAIADTDLENKIKADIFVYGGLIDSSRAGFYAIHKLTDSQGLILYQAFEGAAVSIPSFAEGQDLAKYQIVDAGAFRYDRKKDWEEFQGQPVVLQGLLKVETDGLFLEVSDGLIKLIGIDTFSLLNMQIAQKKGKAVTLYGIIGETFDWKTARKETHKMFRFSLDTVSYAAMTSS